MHSGTPKGIRRAVYVSEYILLVTFTNGIVKKVNFSKAFKKYAVGYYAKYSSENEFKKFKVEDYKIVWGVNWDLVFEVEKLYNGEIFSNP